jgi:tetratricopeptide (TPR) repeat protein
MFDFTPASSPDEALSRARKLEAQKKVDKAIKTLEKSLKGTPQDFELLLELGRLHFSQRGLKEAASRFKQANNLAPKQKNRFLDVVETAHYQGSQPPETGELLLEVYTEMGDFDQFEKIVNGLNKKHLDGITKRNEGKLNSIMSHKTSADLSPRDISLHYLLAFLYGEKGEEKKMENLFETIIQASPEESDRILKYFQRIAVSRYNDPLPYLSVGDLQLKRDKSAEAVTAFRKVLEMDESKRGDIIQRLENYRTSTKDSVSPKSILPVLELLSQLYTTDKELDKAIELLKILRKEGLDLEEIVKGYREVLRHEPEHSKARFELGETYLEQGRKDLALEQFAHSSELDPEQGEQAMERYRKIFEKDPGNPTALIHIVDSSVQRELWSEAVSVLRKGFEANPSIVDEILPRLQPILLRVWNDEGEIDPAKLDGSRNPHYIDALALLGQCYTKKGKAIEAVMVYDHLLSLESTGGVLEEVKSSLETIKHPLASVLLGVAWTALGGKKEGINQFASIGKTSPELVPEIFFALNKLVQREEKLAKDVYEVYESLKELADPFLLNFARGETLTILKKGELACEAYRKCIELNPSNRKEVNLALTHLLKREPNLIKAHLLLGDSYLEAGEIKDATVAFEKVSSLDPDAFEKIYSRYRKVLQKDPNNLHIHKAVVEGLYKKKLYGQVREECEKRIALFPKEGFFNLRLGEAHTQEGQLKEAIPHLLRAVQSNKDYIPTSERTLKRILSVDPTLIDARFGLGNLSILMGHYEEACSQFREIAFASPDKRPKAIQGLKKVIEENRTFGKAYIYMGELLFEDGNIQEGLTYFHKGIEISSDLVDSILLILRKRKEPEAFLLSGKCYILKGLYPLASENFLKAFSKNAKLRQEVIHGLFQISQRDPEDLTSQYALSRIYRNEKKFVEAVETLSQIARKEEDLEKLRKELRELLYLDRSNDKGFFLLGNLALRRGDIEEAVESFEASLGTQSGITLLDQVIMALRNAAKSNHPKANLSLAKVLIRKGEIKEAVGLISQLVKMKNGWIDDGMKVLKEMLVQTHSPEGSLLLGKLYLERGDEKGAEETLSRGLRASNPPDVQLYILLYLSRSLSRLGQEDQARERLDSAFKLGRDRKEVYQLLTQIGKWERQAEIRKIEQRIKEIQGSPSENPVELSENLLRMISLYREMGDINRAMELLREFGRKKSIVTISNSDVQKRYLRELALCHLHNGKLLDACEILRGISITGSPMSSFEKEILDVQARCFEQMGDWILALSCLKRLAQEDSDYRRAGERIKRLTMLLTLERIENRPRVLTGTTTI